MKRITSLKVIIIKLIVDIIILQIHFFSPKRMKSFLTLRHNREISRVILHSFYQRFLLLFSSIVKLFELRRRKKLIFDLICVEVGILINEMECLIGINSFLRVLFEHFSKQIYNPFCCVQLLENFEIDFPFQVFLNDFVV